AVTTTASGAAPFVQSLLQDAGQNWYEAIEALFRLSDWLRTASPMPRDVVLDEELHLPNEIVEPPMSEPLPVLDAGDSVNASDSNAHGAALLGLVVLVWYQTVSRIELTVA